MSNVGTLFSKSRKISIRSSLNPRRRDFRLSKKSPQRDVIASIREYFANGRMCEASCYPRHVWRMRILHFCVGNTSTLVPAGRWRRKGMRNGALLELSAPSPRSISFAVLQHGPRSSRILPAGKLGSCYEMYMILEIYLSANVGATAEVRNYSFSTKRSICFIRSLVRTKPRPRRVITSSSCPAIAMRDPGKLSATFLESTLLRWYWACIFVYIPWGSKDHPLLWETTNYG